MRAPLLIILATQLLGVLLFAFGFFPQRVSRSGFATLEQDVPMSLDPVSLGDRSKGLSFGGDAAFGRLVVMVVDALRADFVYSNDSRMSFTRSLVQSQQTFSYIGVAQAPTVTLPRIKALTSGGIPSFVDFVMNFRSQALTEDNVVTQLWRAGKKIVFYGDDTWLKLFPSHFVRSEGTTSFFVADTVEVDNNVTRHLKPELKADDWEVMILHYLGLDHVGHSGGPDSALMGPKQQEMDDIVRLIHESLTQSDKQREKPTLFLLCSDHGMNQLGNHGSSTEGEVSTVLLFMSSAFQNKRGGERSYPLAHKVSQVDLVPTLSLLFGLPIPRNSLGILITELFAHRDPREYMRALQVNAHQQVEVMKANSMFWSNGKPANSHVERLLLSYQEAMEGHKSWLAGGDLRTIPHSTAFLYREFLRDIQEEWRSILSEYDFYYLVVGTALLGLSSLASIFFCCSLASQDLPSSLWEKRAAVRAFSFGIALLALHLVVSNFFLQSSLASNYPLVALAILCSCGCAYLILLFHRGLFRTPSSVSIDQAFALICVIVYLISLSGSSNVEEEHQTWYFLTATFYFILGHKIYQSAKVTTRELAPLLLLVTARIARGWNQTGNKWLGAPDYAKWLTAPEHWPALYLLSLLGVVAPSLLTIFLGEKYKRQIGSKVRLLFQTGSFISALATASYKFDWLILSPVEMARAGFFGVFLVVVAAVSYSVTTTDKSSIASLGPTMSMIALVHLFQLLHRVHNLFLFALFGLQILLVLATFEVSKTPAWVRFLLLTWMGNASWFAFGNSNSLSTIDISGAYTGLTGYSEVLVGLFTALIGFSGPILFFVASFLVLARVTEENSQVPLRFHVYEYQSLLACSLVCALRSLSLFAFSVFITLLRHHLFIWSVFSPKYIYEIAFMAFDGTKCAALLLTATMLTRLCKWDKKKSS